MIVTSYSVCEISRTTSRTKTPGPMKDLHTDSGIKVWGLGLLVWGVGLLGITIDCERIHLHPLPSYGYIMG